MNRSKALSMLYAALACLYGLLVAPAIFCAAVLVFCTCLIVAALILAVDVIQSSWKFLRSGGSSSSPPQKLHSDAWASDEDE